MEAQLFSWVLTLLLVMDPLGNVPLFLSVLRAVPPERRRRVLAREVLIAYAVLLAFLLAGDSALRMLGIEQESVSIAGGIVLFLIALRMLFPGEGHAMVASPQGEPFVVPLAIPLVAGPSTLATVLLLQRAATASIWWLLLALTIAWAISAVVLFSSTALYRALGERGLVAMERLMGMLLVMIAVQMLVNGLQILLAR
jgi:multiple antibiotic resistance protein